MLSAIISLFFKLWELGLASLLAKPVLFSRVVALSAPYRGKRKSLSVWKFVELGLASLLAKPILQKKLDMCSLAKRVAVTLSAWVDFPKAR